MVLWLAWLEVFYPLAALWLLLLMLSRSRIQGVLKSEDPVLTREE